MKVKFWNPNKQYLSIKEEVDKEMQRVLEAGDLILREDVEKFEKDFAKFVGTKYAVGLNSGTDALYLALKVLNIGIGDKVLVPSYTFVATVQIIKQLGAEPVFYDLDGAGESLEGVRAIIAVHMEGALQRKFIGICNLAENLSIPVIEDACQALGAEGAGSTGYMGAFSFYPAKLLGCFGDGGALVTDDEEVYNKVKELRNHYKETNAGWGINSRLDNLQAAVLNVKLKYLPEVLRIRQNIAEMYNLRLKGVSRPAITSKRVWQDYVIRTKQRDELYEYLKEKGIETMKNNYPFPVPKLPLTQKYENETLRIPCNETLTTQETEYVIKCINEWN